MVKVPSYLHGSRRSKSLEPVRNGCLRREIWAPIAPYRRKESFLFAELTGSNRFAKSNQDNDDVLVPCMIPMKVQFESMLASLKSPEDDLSRGYSQSGLALFPIRTILNGYSLRPQLMNNFSSFHNIHTLLRDSIAIYHSLQIPKTSDQNHRSGPSYPHQSVPIGEYFYEQQCHSECKPTVQFHHLKCNQSHGLGAE